MATQKDFFGVTRDLGYDETVTVTTGSDGPSLVLRKNVHAQHNYAAAPSTNDEGSTVKNDMGQIPFGYLVPGPFSLRQRGIAYTVTGSGG